MSLYKGTELLAGVATNTISNAHSLFDFIWSDHIKNEMSWVNANYFSWLDGTVYVAAYNHLVADLGTIEQGGTWYGWVNKRANVIYTKKVNPSVNDIVYFYDDGEFSEVGTISSITQEGITTTYSPFIFERESSEDIEGSPSSSAGATQTTETIGSYTITYWLATDGHKICLPDQETTVNNIYNESGVAWYYILDTSNQRFKLPRTKYGFTGLRDTVGKYVPESLPNIKANGPVTILSDQVTFSGAFYKEWSAQTGNPASGSYRAGLGFDASLSSSTYQDNAPVQQRATQMYLYFYVGEYSQSQAEQVATLDVQMFLNKADIDLNNLSASGQAVIDGKANTSLSNLSSAGQALFTAKLDADKIQQVSTLPVSPVAGTLYLIPE